MQQLKKFYKNTEITIDKAIVSISNYVKTIIDINICYGTGGKTIFPNSVCKLNDNYNIIYIWHERFNTLPNKFSGNKRNLYLICNAHKKTLNSIYCYNISVYLEKNISFLFENIVKICTRLFTDRYSNFKKSIMFKSAHTIDIDVANIVDGTYSRNLIIICVNNVNNLTIINCCKLTNYFVKNVRMLNLYATLDTYSKKCINLSHLNIHTLIIDYDSYDCRQQINISNACVKKLLIKNAKQNFTYKCIYVCIVNIYYSGYIHQYNNKLASLKLNNFSTTCKLLLVNTNSIDKLSHVKYVHNLQIATYKIIHCMSNVKMHNEKIIFTCYDDYDKNILLNASIFKNVKLLELNYVILKNVNSLKNVYELTMTNCDNDDMTKIKHDKFNKSNKFKNIKQIINFL